VIRSAPDNLIGILQDVMDLWFCRSRSTLSTTISLHTSRARTAQHELASIHATTTNATDADALKRSKPNKINDLWEGSKNAELSIPGMQIAVQRTVDVSWDGDSELDVVSSPLPGQ
jgi:hypothetical protein